MIAALLKTTQLEFTALIAVPRLQSTATVWSAYRKPPALTRAGKLDMLWLFYRCVTGGGPADAG